MPYGFYSQQISDNENLLKGKLKHRNIVTICKLLSFATIVYAVYLAFSGSIVTAMYVGVPSLLLFLILSVIDSRIVKQIKLTKSIIECATIECAYLNGDLSKLSDGNRYTSPEHAYTFDLDIFGKNSLFQSMNRTVSFRGEEFFAHSLQNLCTNIETIRERQDSVQELTSKMEWCQRFRATGKITDTNDSRINNINEWLSAPSFFKNNVPKVLLIISNAITVTSWILVAFGVISYIIALTLSILQLIILSLSLKRINKTHSQLNGFLSIIRNYISLIELIIREDFKSNKLSSLKQNLTGEKNALAAFSELNKILEAFDQRGNVIVWFLLNGLYLKDFHCVIKIDNWKSKYSQFTPAWIDVVSEFDMLISMAIFRFNHPKYVVPEIEKSIVFEAKSMGHPLLDTSNMITNDFSVKKLNNLFIVTGANMAGKSTFLRSVGVNIVLALSGNVVCCSELRLSPTQLFTSMRTTDNLASGTSYFHAELLRLKTLVDIAATGIPMFIILDEMLKGTNSKDKQIGSEAFLKKLLSYRISGLVATHDLALGDMSASDPEHFFNVCFEIDHAVNDDIVYDYKLRQGVSQNMNASILLKKMGLI